LLSAHESVVSRDLGSLGLSWAGRLLVADFKMALILLVVVFLGVFVDAINLHHEAEHVDATTGVDLIAGEIVISDEGLAGLLDLVTVGQLLSSEEAGE